MEQLLNTEVAILGGGCAGLWLANEVTDARYSCILVDEQQLGGYSSTRNQGWLQSGALYAAEGQDVVAQECREGYDAIVKIARQICPSCLGQEAKSYFLYSGQFQFYKERQALENAGIRHTVQNIQKLRDGEPLLDKSRLQYAIETTDVPVDTRQLLISLTDKLLSSGGRVLLLENGLKEIRFQSNGNGWDLRLENVRLNCQVIVLCCGALIPDLLQKLTGTPSPGKDWLRDMGRTRVAVAIAHQRLTNSMLLVREISGPNIVPFNGGVSICISGADQPIHSYAEAFVEELEIERTARQLSISTPGILNRTPFATHFYSCQKLDPNAAAKIRSAYWKNHAPPDSGGLPGVYSFYPGKFTSAPVAAKKAVQEIKQHLGTPTKQPSGLLKFHPKVARRQYYNVPTHVGFDSQGWLAFKRTDHRALDIYPTT